MWYEFILALEVWVTFTSHKIGCAYLRQYIIPGDLHITMSSGKTLDIPIIISKWRLNNCDAILQGKQMVDFYGISMHFLWLDRYPNCEITVVRRQDLNKIKANRRYPTIHQNNSTPPKSKHCTRPSALESITLRVKSSPHQSQRQKKRKKQST